MSRLFSRLENMGQDQAEGAPADGPGRPADVLPPSPADAGSPSTGFTPTDAPAMPLPVPGYSISASLARPALPEIAIPMSAPTGTTLVKPGWPTKIWLASLLLLVGLSMLMLAMPERLLPLAGRPAPVEAAAAAAAEAAAPPASAVAEVADRPAPPSASAVVTAVPAARALRKPAAAPAAAAAAAVAPVAPIAPAPPAPSASSAACSDAMLAMNLCSKPSP